MNELQKFKGPSFSDWYNNVNCISATSYNCVATITFFLIAQHWTTNDATTINISFSAINCTQPRVQLTGLLPVVLGIWMQHGDIKIFIVSHPRAEPNIFIWGGIGRVSFATRGAANGLCRTFRKRPENFWGGHWGDQAKFWWRGGPPGTPLAPPLVASTYWNKKIEDCC